MSAAQKRLVFERGDSAAVLLFNRDRRCLVLVRQFRAPTLGKGCEDGWITETVAGLIDAGETPEATAIRETMEETGYRISELQHIATFFASPGGSSERVFLYYAETSESDRIGRSADTANEDIELCYMGPDELFALMRCRAIEDVKLWIGALWLRDAWKNIECAGSE
jgi:ADP-ribose pyrophosphatase